MHCPTYILHSATILKSICGKFSYKSGLIFGNFLTILKRNFLNKNRCFEQL